MHKKNKKKKILIWTGAIVIAVLAIGGILAGTNLAPAQLAKAEALEGKNAFERAQNAMLKQQFPEAEKELEQAQFHFEAAQTQVDALAELKLIPGLRRQIVAIEHVLDAGVHIAIALERVTIVGADITSVIQNDGDISFKDISPEQKRDILQKLYEAPPDLKAAQVEIDLATQTIDEIPEEFLLGPVKQAVQPLKENLPILKSIIDQAVPLAETFPVIAGYPTEKTYLFLLQNNREMRPTGGFIGTYGILKLKDGEISQFTTDNIYNLDGPAEEFTNLTPPDPILRYTGTKKWLMRDSNWSPDFPTSAKKAEELYLAEGGTEQQIDGTIAVTPTFIESLLTLTGPITAGGIEFTPENLFVELEDLVEFGFARAGVSDADRKDIIGILATKLMDELLGMPKSRFPDLWQTFVKDVDEKQILIYLKDPNVQDLVVEENWAGEIKHVDGDYIFIVDANLAALKTDDVMERSIQHGIAEQDGKLVGTTSIHYKNNGSFTNIYTRYRTFNRIYIPLGSQLLSAEGYLTTDLLQGGKPTTPSVTEDAGYTVIQGFTSIEPGEEGSLTISYALPDSIYQQAKEGNYNLYVQKQAGTIEHGLSVTVDIGRAIEVFNPLDIGQQIGDNLVRFDTNLRTDRELSVQFQ